MPTSVNRAANTLPGLVPGAGFLVYGAEAGTAGEWAVALAAVLACGILAVRGYRAGVRCEAERLVVRGFVRTRVIPRAAVTGVTDFPAVRWTTPGGDAGGRRSRSSWRQRRRGKGRGRASGPTRCG